MIRAANIKIPVGYGEEQVRARIAKNIHKPESDILGYSIIKQSIDARDKNNIFYLCSYNVEIKGNNDELTVDEYIPPLPCAGKPGEPPVVVGSGPAGLFAALLLAEAGLCPIVLERGHDIDARVVDVEAFFKGGKLNKESNVQFGEGGAGTFSDGKLTANYKDLRAKYVLRRFAEFGAPCEILYMSKPHIGTDNLTGIVKNMRKKIEKMGGQFRFSTKFCGFEADGGRIKSVLVFDSGGKCETIKTSAIVLAIGHSARDTFEVLLNSGVVMKPKPFAVGVRIEHKQEFIDEAQYGRYAGKLPHAEYKLTYKAKSGRGVYTFCMCPGGYVAAAASENEGVCVNGMSNFKRNAENANSAILVTVTPDDFGYSGALSGVKFQRDIEGAAFFAGGGNYFAPAQDGADFLRIDGFKAGGIAPSYRPGVVFTEIDKCLPEFIAGSIAEAMYEWNKKIKGFIGGVLTAPETRSSSPVTIMRNENYEAVGIAGLYPCGEGSGYAGGIVSSAVDGIKCAEMICRG